MNYSVKVTWAVEKEYTIEASNRAEAEKKVKDMIDRGEVCVWTDGFTAGDEVKVTVNGKSE